MILLATYTDIFSGFIFGIKMMKTTKATEYITPA